MDNEKEDAAKRLSIERFRHFKGIQLESTGQYFCCDFYEIVHPDSSVSYRIAADTRNEKLSTEIYLDGTSWRSRNTAIPQELEQRLIEIIEDTFYENNKALPELPSKPVDTYAYIRRLKNILLRKFILMKQKSKEPKRLLPIIIVAIALFFGAVLYAIYLESSADQYILPYGYTGNVTIVYNQQTGASPKSKDGQRQFYISTNGVLVTQSEYHRNKATQFYYLLSDSSLRQISPQMTVGPSMSYRMSTEDTFSVGEIKVSYVDSLKGYKAVFKVAKSF